MKRHAGDGGLRVQDGPRWSINGRKRSSAPMRRSTGKRSPRRRVTATASVAAGRSVIPRRLVEGRMGRPVALARRRQRRTTAPSMFDTTRAPRSGSRALGQRGGVIHARSTFGGAKSRSRPGRRPARAKRRRALSASSGTGLPGSPRPAGRSADLLELEVGTLEHAGDRPSRHRVRSPGGCGSLRAMNAKYAGRWAGRSR